MDLRFTPSIRWAFLESRHKPSAWELFSVAAKLLSCLVLSLHRCYTQPTQNQMSLTDPTMAVILSVGSSSVILSRQPLSSLYS